MVLQIVHNFKVSGRKTTKIVLTNVRTFWYEGYGFISVTFKDRSRVLEVFDPKTDILNII